MLWYEEDPKAKSAAMSDILPLIRFPLMSADDLQVQTAAFSPACNACLTLPAE